MKTILFLGAILLLPRCALGLLRLTVYDFQLVECDLAVVARIEPGTLKRVGRKSDVKLIVAETLKGVAPGEIFDVRINALVIVGGRYYDGVTGVYLRGGKEDYPKTKIVLHEGGLASETDLSRNAIWFLRKNKDGTGYVLKRSAHAQPATFKPYFAALLSGDHGKVLTLLSHKDQAIRMRVLKYLSGFHRPQDVGHVLPLLRDQSEAVGARAAQAAAEIADAAAVPQFRKALGHKNPEVRTVAATFLSRFRDVQSVPAIGRALPDLGPLQQRRVLANLGRMQSRKVVPVLLEFLDEHMPTDSPSDDRCYQASKAAATSLRELTGVRFPLDTPEARGRWERLKAFPDEVLIRKGILVEIENLTHSDHYVRLAAFRGLGKLVNQHFGSHGAFDWKKEDAEREDSQKLWRRWAAANLTRSHLDWIYDGFKASGIELPRPMDKRGIDTLIKVLTYYRDWNKAEGRPLKWMGFSGVQTDFHRYNANLLLERHTGHTVGMSPYQRDLGRSWQKRSVLVDRWADWWRKQRGRIKLKPWPGARRVTAEMLSKVPDILSPPAPIRVTIRTSKATYTRQEPVVVHVQVTNVSSRAITIAKRPRDMTYASKTDWGTVGVTSPSGQREEDFVTLKPGGNWEWDEAKALFGALRRPVSVQDCQFRLTYLFAGSQFGLRAWRGEVTSNRITCMLTK